MLLDILKWTLNHDRNVRRVTAISIFLSHRYIRVLCLWYSVAELMRKLEVHLEPLSTQRVQLDPAAGKCLGQLQPVGV
jgi:hypothetical protein